MLLHRNPFSYSRVMKQNRQKSHNEVEAFSTRHAPHGAMVTCAHIPRASGNTENYINEYDFRGAFLVPRLHSIT